MSDFYKKRIEYINNWPDSTPFEAELEYKTICDNFKEKNGRPPFNPMKMWETCKAKSDDIDSNAEEPLNDQKINEVYNRVISHIIEALGLIPYKPNLAVFSLFTGFDNFSKIVYQKKSYAVAKRIANKKGKTKVKNDNSITLRIKIFYNEMSNISSSDNQATINDILKELFNCIPLDICKYLYNNLIESNKKAYTRVIQNEEQGIIIDNKNLITNINDKFDLKKYPDFDKKDEIERIKIADDYRRKAGRLYQKIFKENEIEINTAKVKIDNKFRLNLMTAGIIYTLRNETLHGSLMAATKSSKTDLRRYASNYYCFIAIYILLMLLLIEHSSDNDEIKKTYYTELLNATKKNMIDFHSLFGNYLE